MYHTIGVKDLSIIAIQTQHPDNLTILFQVDNVVSLEGGKLIAHSHARLVSIQLILGMRSCSFCANWHFSIHVLWLSIVVHHTTAATQHATTAVRTVQYDM